MQVLRYGETTAWAFRGFDLPTGVTIETAFLTIKAEWPTIDEEAPPNPPRLQLAVVPPSSADGTFTQDDEGNWAVVFNLTPIETADDLGPPPRFLWYEVTLVAEQQTFRPIIGQIRMLPVIYAEASS